MYVLSIDASTKSTGYAIFKDRELIYFDYITANDTNVCARILKITEQLEKVIRKNPIDKIVFEEVRPDTGAGGNVHTHKMLMWLQASIALVAYQINPFIFTEYMYPSQWRKVCGIKNGRGVTRDQVKKNDVEFVKNKFNIEVNDDIADAIGIGYAYIIGQPKTLNFS